MELTERTLKVLKNFSTINNGLEFKPGNRLRTITELPTIMATAELDTEIETGFCIADLPRFLSVLSLVEEPKLDITNERVMVRRDGVMIRYLCADKSMIVTPPDSDIEFPPADIKFTMSADMLKNLTRAAAVLRLSEMAVLGDGKKLSLRLVDTDGKVQDYYNVMVGDTDKQCKVVINMDNLKLIPADYSVSIGHRNNQGISRFKGIDFPVEYYVAVSSKSKYA